MISFDLVSAPATNIVELKRDIRKALLDAGEGKSRYCFLEEKGSYSDSLTIRDKYQDINIRIFFDRQTEVTTSNLMKQYFDMDERLKKLVIFLKNWIPEESKGVKEYTMMGISDRILGRKFNDLSIKCMLTAFMQKQKLIPNLQKRVLKINKNEYPGIIESIEEQNMRNHIRRSLDRTGIDRVNTHFYNIEEMQNMLFK